jgi:hypothetical protein
MAKGQGISINVIVIAAIALLVLVILSTLVIRYGSTVNQGANSCSKAPTGGNCRLPPPDGDGCRSTEFQDPNRGCQDPGLICCVNTQ